MERLEQLEKALKEYKEMLEKNMQAGYSSTGMPAGTSGGGSAVNTTMPMGVEKKEHEDEKEDKKMIEEKLDEHNEKKHGEAKDADTAMKTELIKFNDLGQWSMNKADQMDLAPEGKYKASHKEVMDGDDGKVEIGGKGVDGDKGQTVENKKRG